MDILPVIAFGVGAVKVDSGKTAATIPYDPDKAQPDALIRATTHDGLSVDSAKVSP